MRAESTIAATVWRPCNTFGESFPLFPILTISPHIDKNACKLRRKSAFTCKHWKKYLGNFLLVVGMMRERFFIYHWLSVSGRLKTHWPPHLLQALNGWINFIFLSTVITKLNALSCRACPLCNVSFIWPCWAGWFDNFCNSSCQRVGWFFVFERAVWWNSV